MPENYRIIVTTFLVVDKANRVRFFEKTFLVANVSPEIVLGMPFFTLSGIDIDFLGRELWWKTYITNKAFLTTKHVELVRKKKFIATVLDPEYKTFIVHVTSLSSILLDARP